MDIRKILISRSYKSNSNMITIENFHQIIGMGVNGWHVHDAYELSNRYVFHIKHAVVGWLVNGNGNNIVNEVTVILHRDKSHNGMYMLTTDYVTNPLSMITDIDTTDIENINLFAGKLDKHITNLFK